MTVAELVALAKDWVEDDAITDRVRLYLINQIEGKIQSELLQIDNRELLQYSEEDLDSQAETEMLLLEPFTDVYVTWMVAMSYQYAGEYDTYQVEQAMFQAAWYRLARAIAEREHSGSNDVLNGYQRRRTEFFHQRRPMFLVYQGSTPTLELVLPLDISGGGYTVYATMVQGGAAVLEYTLNGTPATNPPTGQLIGDEYEGTLLLLCMTQADTLRLKPGKVVLQLRVKAPDGEADTFAPICGICGKALKGGVI